MNSSKVADSVKYIPLETTYDSFVDINFCEMNDNNVLLTNNLLPAKSTINPYEYQLFEVKSNKYKLKESLFPFKVESKDIATQFSYLPIFYHKGHLLFMSGFSDILYEYDTEVKPKYLVKSTKDFPDEKYLAANKDIPLMELRQKLRDKGLSTGIRDVIELPQYILLGSR